MQAGRYKARASAVAMGVASTGNEQIIISFGLDTGDSISWYGYFSERAPVRRGGCVTRPLELARRLAEAGVEE